MRKYLDDFIKLPVAKMAQQIANMTFSYKETKVPPAHYKKILNKSYEEIVEDNIAVNLLNIYYKTIKQLAAESPRWFMQALICNDLKINPASISNEEYQALELVYSQYADKKHVKFANQDMENLFNDILRNGSNAILEHGNDSDKL